MISIIICSRFQSISKELKDNIENTVGVVHEIICIDNSKSQYDIFSAYNEGVKRSQYPLLCFMHEDILHYTNDWGKLLINHFRDLKVGLIGISGPRFISQIPGIWWGPGSTDAGKDAICQYSIDTNRADPTITYNTCFKPIADANAIEVVAVDGCFFCMRKSVFGKIRFDEINYKGFHFYDLDISLQVYMLGLKSLCVYDILIEHVSNSKLDNEWLTNARIFFTKWKDCLPIVNYPVSAKERRVLEKNNLQTMNYIINENNRKPSRYYKFSEKLYLLRYCCDKKMLQSLIY